MKLANTTGAPKTQDSLSLKLVEILLLVRHCDSCLIDEMLFDLLGSLSLVV